MHNRDLFIDFYYFDVRTMERKSTEGILVPYEGLLMSYESLLLVIEKYFKTFGKRFIDTFTHQGYEYALDFHFRASTRYSVPFAYRGQALTKILNASAHMSLSQVLDLMPDISPFREFKL